MWEEKRVRARRRERGRAKEVQASERRPDGGTYTPEGSKEHPIHVEQEN